MRSQETKNKIKNSLQETRYRRKSQIVKVIELKVNIHQLPKETLKKMNEAFKQAKWIVNDIISSDDIFKYDYQKHKQVSHFDKDGNTITSDITLNSVMHRAIIKSKIQDVLNESKAKKKGRKVGKLKFKSEVNCIPILTGPWLKIQKDKRITIPGFPKLKVYGMKQLKKYSDYELADDKFLRKASGFYVHVTIMIPKNSIKRKPTHKEVGLDFGITDNITTSDGDKYNFSKRESEYLKFLQKQLHRKQKDSKRYWRLRNQIQKEYEHISNQKNDFANKLVSKLLKDYDWIYFQDESLAQWRKYNKGFAREIQGSILGRVKLKLVRLENKRTTKISKWVPTTKACTNCGQIHNEMTLNDRIFKCDCGIEIDRDIHAAQNVKIFGSRKRTGCLEQASAEDYINTLALLALQDNDNANISVETKNEDSPF
jgi:putative transposase